MPRIIVEVMPKPEILDPQGKASSTHSPTWLRRLLGRTQGKRFELTVDGEVTEEILEQARRPARDALQPGDRRRRPHPRGRGQHLPRGGQQLR